jgi:hypothetical protein
LVASFSWDQPRLTRHLRTCGPIRFIAGFVTTGTVTKCRQRVVFTRTQISLEIFSVPLLNGNRHIKITKKFWNY